jgi:hypothetical protein
VAACHAQGEKGNTWFPFEEPRQQPFTPEELAQLEWAWFSRPVGDGRWEGVAVKGTPRE